jgi:hypothetical protein
MAMVEPDRKRFGKPRIGSQSVPNSVNEGCAQVDSFGLTLSRVGCFASVSFFFSQGMVSIAAATPEKNLPSQQRHPNRGDDRAVYIHCGARTDWTANTFGSGCRAFTDWRFGKFVCFNIDSELKSERCAHTRIASTIFQIAVSCRLECSSRTLVESRFAAQTRCKSRCEVSAEATLHHLK